jgi:hypothetical protein
MQVDDGGETSDKCAENVRRLAVDSFANHQVINERDGEWLCRKPGRSEYWFKVIARPGVLIVFGDIGDWILWMSDKDPIRWAAAAARSPGYFFEKLHAAPLDGRDEFYPADLRAWLRDRLAGCREDSAGAEHCQRALDELDERESHNDYLTRNMAMEVMSECGFDDVYHLGVAPSARSYWLLEAMRWFTARVPTWLMPEQRGVAGG